MTTMIPLTEKRPQFRLIRIDDARFMFRPNFSGEGSKYNNVGDRNFNVRITDPELLERMEEEPWNLKYTKVTEDYPEPEAYLKVKVDFNPPMDRLVPHIYVVNNGQVVSELTEEDVHMLDENRIAMMKMVIRPSVYADDRYDNCWKISAYLKTLYVEFADEEDDEWADEYDLAAFKNRV